VAAAALRAKVATGTGAPSSLGRWPGWSAGTTR